MICHAAAGLNDFIFLFQLRQEKCELEETLEKEQEYQVNKLMRKIEKLEAETLSKQTILEQVSYCSRCEIEHQLTACLSGFSCVVRKWSWRTHLNRNKKPWSIASGSGWTN